MPAQPTSKWRQSLWAVGASGCILVVAACGGASSEAELMASARSMLDRGDNSGAQVQLKSAIQKNAANAEARYLLGKVFLANGELAAAEVELNKARELKRLDEPVMVALAQTWVGLRKYSKIVEEFGNATLADKNLAAQLNASLGLAFAHLDKMDEGRSRVNRALELAPHSSAALVAEAKLALMEKDVERAVKSLDSVLSADSKNLDALILKGEILAFLRNDLDGARLLFQRGLAIQPNSLLLHTAIVSAEMRRTSGSKAKADLEAMAKVFPNHPQMRYLSAVVAYIGKDYKAAREALDPLEKNLPDDLRLLQLGGAISYQLGEFRQGEAKLKKALLLKDNLIFARQTLAQIYIRTGQPLLAIQALSPILKSGPADFETLSLAAEASVEAGDYLKAEELYGSALKLQPDRGDVKIALALTDLAKGRAESGFSQLERIASTDASTVADLAIISARMRQGATPELMSAIDRLQAKEPNRPLPHDLRARALLLKRDVAGARQSFEQALKIDSTYFPAAVSLAALDRAEGNFQSARGRLKGVLTANPNHVQARMADIELVVASAGDATEVEGMLKAAVGDMRAEWEPRVALVDFYLSSSRSDQALSVAQEAAVAFPNSMAVLDGLGRAQVARGDFGQATSTFKRMSGLDAASPLPYRRLAEASAQQNNYSDAVKYMRRALSIAPSDRRLAEAVFELALRGKLFDEALMLAREYQRQRATEALGLMLEGDVEAYKRRWPEAIQVYKRSLVKDREASKVAIKLYQVLNASGAAKEAQAMLDDWLKTRPRDTGLRLFLADSALTAKDLPLAESRYREVLAVDPKHVSALNNLAWLMVRQGKPGASAIARQAIDLQPGSPPIEDTLAQALASEGQVQAAMDLQRKVVAKMPSAPAFRVTLARILLKAGNKAEARGELEKLSKLGAKLAEHKEVERLLLEAGQ